MGWFGWTKDSAGNESNTKVEKKGGTTYTHHLSTAGRGGSRSNHSHTIVRERGGRKTAHCVPHKHNRKK